MANLTQIVTGMEKGPEAIEANFKTLGQVGDLKHFAISTVSTVLNGLRQDIEGEGTCSFEVVDPINRVARISFEMGVSWPDGYQSSHGGLKAYSTQDVFQFSSSLFKSVVPNTPITGKYNFNKWGNCNTSTYLHGYTVGFKVNNSQALNTDGGTNVAGSFLAYY